MLVSSGRARAVAFACIWFAFGIGIRQQHPSEDKQAHLASDGVSFRDRRRRMSNCRERPAPLIFNAEYAARNLSPRSGYLRVEFSAGTFVAVCAPLDARRARSAPRIPCAGPCPAGTELLLKVVAAVAGDVIAVSVNGVVVNGRPLPRSRPLSLDGAGRRLSPWPSGALPARARPALALTPITSGAGTRVIGVRQRWYTLRLGQSRYSCPVHQARLEQCH